MAPATTDTKPPYGGFAAFWNFIAQLHDYDHMPGQLDRTVMGNRGGSQRSELYTALRFFGLIDGDKKPTAELRALAGAPTAENLRGLVEHHYAPVIALNLNSATPRMVDDALLAIGSTQATVQRARAFFLNAAENSKIGFGQMLKANRGSSSSGPRKKRTAKNGNAGVKAQAGKKGDENATPQGVPDIVRVVVADLPPKDDWAGKPDAAKKWLNILTQALSYGYDLELEQLTEAGP